MKGIRLCAECANYSMKKHRCIIGCNKEENAQDKFYDDCPLPDVEPVRTAYWVVVQTTNPTVSTVHRCSNPECRLTTYARRLPPYCQECGSKMLGEAREDDDKNIVPET